MNINYTLIIDDDGVIVYKETFLSEKSLLETGLRKAEKAIETAKKDEEEENEKSK